MARLAVLLLLACVASLALQPALATDDKGYEGGSYASASAMAAAMAGDGYATADAASQAAVYGSGYASASADASAKAGYEKVRSTHKCCLMPTHEFIRASSCLVCAC